MDDLFGEDDAPQSPVVSDDAGSDAEAPALKVVETLLPRHAVVDECEPDTYALKVPVFLKVDARPFDPATFKAAVAELLESQRTGAELEKAVRAAMVLEKLMNENTIRWRYLLGEGQDIIKQSNAHFVEWDDGLVLLKIGLELFDFKQIPVTDQWLVRLHDDHDMLQADLLVLKSVSLLPALTLTSTHRRLTQAVKSIQKKDKILNTISNDDPLLKQRMAEENERKTLKLRRQMELKRRAQEDRRRERAGLPAEPLYLRFARTYGDDEYDEEDDFVAGDDEEVEEEEEEEEEEDDDQDERAERLKRVKEAGADKYKEERKRRRIIDSDDDE